MALHTYAVNDLLNTTERINVTYKLAALSSVLSGSCVVLFGWVTNLWGAFAALGAPSAIVIYLFLIRYTETFLWNKSFGRVLGITVPDLNGEWSAEVRLRTRDGENIQNDTGKMKIKQTWTMIGISFETDTNISDSTGAFLTQQGGRILLTYEYVVEKRHPERDDFEDHKGTATFRVNLVKGGFDLQRIEVPYYTNHQESGTIILIK